MAEVPRVLSGVLAKGDYRDSLEAVRTRLGEELEGGYCDACHREGPRDPKDTAALLYRLTEVLKAIQAAPAPATRPQEAPGATGGGAGSVTSIQDRARALRQSRTGAGTQTTDSPTSVSKRQGPGRRPGAGRKAAGD